MNAKKMKSTMVALSIILVICLTIAGTITYLQDKTDPVVNTFTTSDINITLVETTGPEYKMVPGATIAKDPEVTVLPGSEDCYVYVKIEKSANFDNYMTYAVDTTDAWTLVETGTNYVVYGREAKAGDVFAVLEGDQVVVKDTVTKADMQLIDGVLVEGVPEQAKPTLTFTAYAIQKSNLKNGDGAVNTVVGAWSLIDG